ncbi:MAG TPA: hypothetical protein VNL17_14700 [Verrucomicrobiae bacterium]|nr:hypothetical protein [Verrucomicrobiae bacterium]
MSRKAQSIEETIGGYFATATAEQCRQMMLMARGIMNARFPKQPATRKPRKKGEPNVSAAAN